MDIVLVLVYGNTAAAEYTGWAAGRDDGRKKLIEKKKMLVSENASLHQKHLWENCSYYYGACARACVCREFYRSTYIVLFDFFTCQKIHIILLSYTYPVFPAEFRVTP